MKMHQVLLALLTAISAVSPAFGDTIVITGGSASTASASGKNDPPFGVILTGDDTRIIGVTFTSGLSDVSIGDTVNLSNNIFFSSTPNVPQEEVVQGTHFTDVVVEGTLRVVATPFTFTDPSAALNAPFTMDGVISLFRQRLFEPRGEQLFTASVAGNGTASFGVFPKGDAFGVSGTFYDFKSVAAAPVPEPGTLALLGSGLVAGLAKWRRRRALGQQSLAPHATRA